MSWFGPLGASHSPAGALGACFAGSSSTVGSQDEAAIAASSSSWEASGGLDAVLLVMIDLGMRVSAHALENSFMKRYNVNKYHGAKNFRRDVSRTKLVNVSPKPMRGGYRL